MSSESDISFNSGRKWRTGLSVALSCLGFGILVVMVNYLATYYYKRVQWSEETRFQLTPMTLKVLAGITNEVRVVLFFDREAPLYSSVQGLLKEYLHVYPRLNLETVDYYRDTGRAQNIKSEFQLSSQTDQNAIIFSSQDRYKVIYERELSDYDLSGILRGQTNEVRRSSFKGEVLFTSALVNVTDVKPTKAYFLQGHGEHDAFNEEPTTGYSKFGQVLQEKNISFENLRLAGRDQVPEDCQLLIVAGPETALLDEELQAIESYLIRGGRVLLMFNRQSLGRDTGLENLLLRWGVEVGKNVVFDPEKTVQGYNIIVTSFSGHPSVKALVRSSLYLLVAQSIRSYQPSGNEASEFQGAEVTELAFTGPEGFTRSNITSEGPKPDPKKDKEGEIPLMVAVEKGAVQGIQGDYSASRMIVVGESIFLNNQQINQAANRDFASLAVGWLLDKEIFLAIGPRPVHEYKITLTDRELRKVRWILLAGMPGSILALGILVWWFRRI